MQLTTPVTPVIAQLPAAVGGLAPVGPVTVAVKLIVEPIVPVVASAVTATTGGYLATVVVAPDVRAEAK